MLLITSCAGKSEDVKSVGNSKDAIKTKHYQFYASETVPFKANLRTGEIGVLNLKRNVPKGWLPNEKMVKETVLNLDNIWQHVNGLLEGEMILMVNMFITHGGWGSTAIRGEGTILVSAMHFDNMSMDDILNRTAHESCHLGLYDMSKRKIIDSKNKFIDEGIALYAGYDYTGKLDWLINTSKKIATEDYQAGKASMEYLRNWQENVRNNQGRWLREWAKRNPGKRPTTEDFIKGGYRSYFTAYNFIKFFNNKYGKNKLLDIVRSMGDSDIRVSFPIVVGQSLDSFVSEWHASLK